MVTDGHVLPDVILVAIISKNYTFPYTKHLDSIPRQCINFFSSWMQIYDTYENGTVTCLRMYKLHSQRRRNIVGDIKFFLSIYALPKCWLAWSMGNSIHQSIRIKMGKLYTRPPAPYSALKIIEIIHLTLTHTGLNSLDKHFRSSIPFNT